MMKGIVGRILALIWAWTGGAILGLAIMAIGTLYAIVDIISRLIGFGRAGGVVFRGGMSDTLQWWAGQNSYAILGTGKGFDPLPPFNFMA